MKEKLLKLMPEFGEVEDADLREKTTAVWLEAMREAGWTFDDLAKMPFTLLIADTPVNLVEHTLAVTRCALKIADELVRAAGLDSVFDTRSLENIIQIDTAFPFFFNNLF